MITRIVTVAATFAVAAALAGCSTIVEGTSQTILVNTNPSDASCVFMREGAEIGRVSSTPNSLKIEKTKHDITILCDKAGYQQARYVNHSGAAGATFGNIILGGGIGWAIDSAAGADNKYDGTVNISLVPLQAPTEPAAAITPSH